MTAMTSTVDLVTLAANYGAITAIALYLVHYITSKQNGKLDKIVERLEKIALQQEKILDRLEQLLHRTSR